MRAVRGGVVDLLMDPAVAAALVTPESFEAGRIQLRVEGEWNASELSERLQGAAPAELVLVPLEIENAEAADGFWTWGGVVRPRLALAVGLRESPGEASEGQPVP